jgi:hypothetical protein
MVAFSMAISRWWFLDGYFALVVWKRRELQAKENLSRSMKAPVFFL